MVAFSTDIGPQPPHLWMCVWERGARGLGRETRSNKQKMFSSKVHKLRLGHLENHISYVRWKFYCYPSGAKTLCFPLQASKGLDAKGVREGKRNRVSVSETKRQIPNLPQNNKISASSATLQVIDASYNIFKMAVPPSERERETREKGACTQGPQTTPKSEGERGCMKTKTKTKSSGPTEEKKMWFFSKNSTHHPSHKGGEKRKWGAGGNKIELVQLLAKDDALNKSSIQSRMSTCPVVAA